MLFLRYYFWIGPHILLGIVLGGLIRRNLYKQVPIFCGYAIFELVRFLLLLTINLSPSFSAIQYHWVLLLGLGVSTSLQFGVAYELAQILLVHFALASVLRYLLRWTAAGLLLTAAIASAMLFSSGATSLDTVFRTLDFSSNVILSGLLAFLLMFSRAFHISWRSFSSGIALGFGIFASVELATSALRAALGLRGNIAISIIQMAGYHACVLVWLIYLFLPERTPKFTRSGLEKSEIEFWDQELQRMVRR